jgi:selT/selW/selH-like putative selenoprotein
MISRLPKTQGYKAQYSQFARALVNTFAAEYRRGDFQIDGEIFPPEPWKASLASVLQTIYVIGIVTALAVVFAGKMIDHPTVQHLITRAADYQMYIVFGIAACNLIASQLIATGAFEVMVDGRMIHSKIDTGTMPTIAMITSRLKHIIAQQ